LQSTPGKETTWRIRPNTVTSLAQRWIAA